jgi:exodeoxyribonuclease-3
MPRSAPPAGSSVWFGQKTYNGVALLARERAAGCGAQHPRLRRPAGAGDRRHGGWRAGGGRLFSQRPGARAATSSPTRWPGCRRCAIGRAELASHPQLVLMGDFNIAPDDRDVFDPVAWAGQIHCTPEERAHFQALCGLGLVDAFRLFDQPPRTWSWWDYRNLAFRKNQGLRIDHILVSQALQPPRDSLHRRQAAAQERAPQRPRAGAGHAGRLRCCGIIPAATPCPATPVMRRPARRGSAAGRPHGTIDGAHAGQPAFSVAP